METTKIVSSVQL